jgi:predicted nuclease of restriction endonuclease-like (RecB) superfamily
MSELDFEHLVQTITITHHELAESAARAVNVSLTLRNWLIGGYLFEYEQGGVDRATYGEKLLQALSIRLQAAGLTRSDPRELRRYRQFYLTYPRIRDSLSPELIRFLPASFKQFEIRDSLSPELEQQGLDLVSRLSFTHFLALIKIDDPLKRRFYEVESVRGGWSVRELNRQIASLYFERSGLSTDKEALATIAHGNSELQSPEMVVRDPYIFEFLGLTPQETMGESDLEDALVTHLQAFMLELGRGFCFEARQKRILIGETHCFVDLVFYHRVLKCHVLVELKIDEFRHEHIGQLNTYVSWYADNEMTEGDNPPIGLLLCTQKEHTMVKYALAGMANQLFVSKYALALPDTEALAEFVDARMHEAAKLE